MPTAPDNRTNAQILGELIAGAETHALPTEVLDAARLCLADWLGVALGARDEEAGRAVRRLVAGWATPGRSSVIYGAPTAAPMAALANGTLAHCLDFDDTYVDSITHVSAPVWAATLAVGQDIGADETAMLRAFIVGFETVARLGRGMGQAVTARGLHGTGVFGRIGAAAAAAALLKLDASRAAHALAAAATQAGGLTASFGTMAKPFHAGKAAMDGVLSAQLAAAGFAANPGVLEPDGGLDRAFVQDGSTKISAAVPGPAGWAILRNSFKPYAACHLVHPAVDAVRSAGLAPADVRAIRVRVAPLAMQVTGGASGRPTSPLAAKFDLRYCLAAALHGSGLGADAFGEPWTPASAVLDTAGRIVPEGSDAIGYASASMDIETSDGNTRRIDIATGKGHPGNPMDWGDMAAKLDGLVGRRPDIDTSLLIAALRSFGAGNGALARIDAALADMSRTG